MARETGTSYAYTFETTQLDIPVILEDFHLEDGYLSMTGKALGSDDSSFILKGTKESIYGWVVLRDSDLAYEYTTGDDGQVTVTKVPVSKVYSVCDFGAHPDDPLWTTAGSFGPEGEGHIGEYPGTDIYTFQSLPGATKVFFLDYHEYAEAHDWAKGEEMWKLWQSVSSAYSMFDMNVTTDPRRIAS